MPLKKLLIAPGVDSNATPTLAEGHWSSSNLIRFRNGLLEKIGGWLTMGNTDNSGDPLATTTGIVRGLHAWQDLTGIYYLALGSDQRLQLYTNATGLLTDITPIRKISNLTTPITTNYSIGSQTELFLITDTNHGASVGDWIYFASNIYANNRNNGIFQLLGPQAGQGGFYQINNVVDANNYTIGTFNSFDTNVTGVTALFTTTNTSNSVEVTLGGLAGASLGVGSIFQIYFPVTVGGLTLSGQYIVASVIDSTHFTINATNAATSGASASENSGLVQIQYLLPSGNTSDVYEQGYGAGAYGEGGYGQGSSSFYVTPLRNWFLDNFGQNLVALPTNGTLYQWVPPIATSNVATAVTNAPLYGAGMFVAMPQAQVVILGAETSGTQDPLLIRWCDNGNITVWMASITNEAGSFRLSRGSMIVGGLQGPQFGFIWTDLDLWAMSYIAFPLVYGFNILGSNCGLIAAKAAGILNGNAYWMSIRGFFQYISGSGVTPIPCPIWDKIFTNLSVPNKDKCFCGTNSLFNEVIFFYPSTATNPIPAGAAGEIDSYAKYNVAEGTFDYGSLVRYSWIDQNVFGNPIAVGHTIYPNPFYFDNLIFQHEEGYDDGFAPGSGTASPMRGVSAQTGYIDLEDGTVFLFIDWLVPDFIWKTMSNSTTPSVTITLYTLYTPGDPTPSTFGPYTITPETNYISVRMRARQIAVGIETSAGDTFFRVGAIRLRNAPAGRV